MDPSGGQFANKKRCRICSTASSCRELHRTLDLVGTEASGTSVHMARSTVHDSLDPLNIGLPGTIGTSVGVGNLNTEGNALATIITLRHSLHLLSEIIKSICTQTGA